MSKLIDMRNRLDILEDYIVDVCLKTQTAFEEYRQYFIDHKAYVVNPFFPEKVTEKDIAEHFVNIVNEVNKSIFAYKIFVNYEELREKLFCDEKYYKKKYTRRPNNLNFDGMKYYDSFDKLFASIRSIIAKILPKLSSVSDIEQEYFKNKVVCDIIEFFKNNLSFDNYYYEIER